MNSTVVDTIVCMDGTEVVGAYLAQEFEKRGFRNTNLHDTIYVVTPEYNANNQLIFRDNTIPARLFATSCASLARVFRLVISI